jgi:hypothetical protein
MYTLCHKAIVVESSQEDMQHPALDGDFDGMPLDLAMDPGSAEVDLLPTCWGCVYMAPNKCSDCAQRGGADPPSDLFDQTCALLGLDELGSNRKGNVDDAPMPRLPEPQFAHVVGASLVENPPPVIAHLRGNMKTARRKG